MQRDIRQMVKEGTFLHDYLYYMSRLETPLIYDLACGLWLLSTVVGRTLKINRPKAPVYLNTYFIICAEAGITRKSTAIRMAEQVLEKTNIPDLQLFTSSTTPEAMLDRMSIVSAQAGRTHAGILVSELVTFMGREAYAGGMPGILTDLYDAPQIRTINRIKGERVLKNVYITFLAGSTPSWLVRAINPDVIEGGFTSRCLFVIAERRKQLVAWPQEDDAQGEMVLKLAQQLESIRAKALKYADRGIDLLPGALEYFVSWYNDRIVEAPDSFTASFNAREDHHVLRIAGLLSLSDGSLMISEHHIIQAIKLVDHFKTTAAQMFSTESKEEEKLAAGIDKLRRVLIEAGELGITQTALLFKVRTALPAQQLKYALEIMHELGMVDQFIVREPGSKSKTVWRGTNRLPIRTYNDALKTRMME